MGQKKPIREQRAEAEERSHALLRSIVPESEWRYEAHRNMLGQIVSREPTHLEFTGQHGLTYRIFFHRTSENITQVDRNGYNERGVCGGPYPHNDYRANRRRPEVDQDIWSTAVEEARQEYDTPLQLPKWDVFLGQYLALKYDEDAFLKVANVG